MFRRILALSVTVASLAGLAACSSDLLTTGPNPDPTSAPVPQASTVVTTSLGLGGVQARGDVLSSALAVYTIDVDPASLTATARLKETRGAQANDDLYLLSIDNFLKPDSFAVTTVGLTATTLDLGYEVRHPFTAPTNPAGTPNGTTNRADLGIAGMVLFATDVASATGNTYFDDGSDSVIANTSLVVNADAFYAPAGLLSLAGIANTFPYKTLVDELADPRTSGATGSPISNTGDPTGNFGPNGWTRTEMGTGNDGWTGYGFLHQGQVATNTLSLDRAVIAGGAGFQLDAAIIAKYQDPRGGANAAARKANRLPPATPDSNLFAYRGNHAALDVENIAFAGESGGFITNQISASTLNFHIVDWDARATESTQTDLALEADVTLVAQGEAGLPDLAVSIPGVLGDATAFDDWDPSTDVADDDLAVGGDAAADSGRPGDALYYSKLVTKTPISGQADGTFTGLVRATDPEFALAAPLATPLDGTSLLPLTANLPVPVTYQAFSVDMITPNSAPTASVAGPVAPVASGNGQLTLNVTAYNDADGDPVQIQFDWNNDGAYDDAGETLQTLSGATPIPFDAPGLYNNPTTTPDATRQVPYQYTDGIIAAPITGTITWTLGANQAPVVSAGTVSLSAPSGTTPFTFTLSAVGLTVSDPEGDTPVNFTVRSDANNNGSFEQSASALATVNGYNLSPVMGPFLNTQSQIRFEVYANDPLHATTSGTAVPSTPSPLLGTVNPVAGCGLTMASVNSTLVTLTGASVARSGAVANQAVTGIRVGWTDIATEAEYSIERGVWAPGTTVGSVTFASVGTAVANATTFNDNSISTASGVRYLYRVVPRCSIGGPGGTPSEVAMVALQNFESAAAGGTLLSPTPLDGWIAAYPNTTSPIATFSSTTPLNGNRDAHLLEFGISPSPCMVGFGTPLLNDRAALGPLSASFFEMVHSWGNGGSATSGYTVVANTAHPATIPDAVTPLEANTWRWLATVASGQAYNDNSASSLTANWVSNIATQFGVLPFNFGNGAPGGAFTETFTQFNATNEIITLNNNHILVVGASFSNGSNENARLDDLAWIVY